MRLDLQHQRGCCTRLSVRDLLGGPPKTCNKPRRSPVLSTAMHLCFRESFRWSGLLAAHLCCLKHQTDCFEVQRSQRVDPAQDALPRSAHPGAGCRQFRVSKELPALRRLLQGASSVIVPCLCNLVVALPASGVTEAEHSPFSTCVTIADVLDDVAVSQVSSAAQKGKPHTNTSSRLICLQSPCSICSQCCS